jgi:hypothetical protein
VRRAQLEEILREAARVEFVLGPRRQSGHAESLSMLRGERWSECPFSQRHHAGRKLRTRTDVAPTFFASSQSLAQDRMGSDRLGHVFLLTLPNATPTAPCCEPPPPRLA